MYSLKSLEAVDADGGESESERRARRKRDDKRFGEAIGVVDVGEYLIKSSFISSTASQSFSLVSPRYTFITMVA